jgi:transposase
MITRSSSLKFSFVWRITKSPATSFNSWSVIMIQYLRVLTLVTNVADLNPEKVIERYKSLADIERGFKVLKSELEIGQVYHRLPERIRAHASICFMALVLHRVMRMRLRAANTGITPERALQSLKRIQHHRVSLNGAEPLSGVSSMTDEDSQMLKALKVKQPTTNRQLSLL